MSTGIRWFRVGYMDELPTGQPPERSELLRELVDQLPPKERHVIERTFFGGATLTLAASELKVSSKYARLLRRRGIEQLRRLMYPDAPEVGAVHAAGLEPVANEPVPQP